MNNFYVPKRTYIDRFAATAANKVNRLAVWERTYFHCDLDRSMLTCVNDQYVSVQRRSSG